MTSSHHFHPRYGGYLINAHIIKQFYILTSNAKIIFYITIRLCNWKPRPLIFVCSCILFELCKIYVTLFTTFSFPVQTPFKELHFFNVRFYNGFCLEAEIYKIYCLHVSYPTVQRSHNKYMALTHFEMDDGTRYAVSNVLLIFLLKFFRLNVV